MQLVVDANPLISLIIKPSKVIEFLFLEEIELFSPELLFEELERNKDEISMKSSLSTEELNEFLVILRQRIKIIPEEEFLKQKDEAERICPDEKDMAYFALALHLKCPLWSNEKILRERKYVTVYATHDLMRMFGIL